ncbi:MAG: DMT family transporter [Acidobacteriota bacterium]|nr:MAG: DMT family transporter [Acidobacteriota bacterium]
MPEPYLLRPWAAMAAALALFAIWSNSFIAVGFLVGSEGASARFDWVGLTVARFLPAAAVCWLFCLVFRWRESVQIIENHWRRLLVCGFFAVPGYNLCLVFGQQSGVPAPVASLITTLVPLLVMNLAWSFLDERPTARRLIGFAVAMAGMIVVSLAKRAEATGLYPLLIAITAGAPLSWSIYTVLSKPLVRRVSPLVWTYLTTGVGGLLILPLLPGDAWRQWRHLDAAGWLALLYLSIPCTVLGFAIWVWLLRHLPASSVGFTVFLNPPLTTSFKRVWTLLLPGTFVFTIQRQEWLGGAIVLVGIAIALWQSQAPKNRRQGR